MTCEITCAQLDAMAAAFAADPQKHLAMNAVVKSGIAAAASDANLRRRMRHSYSLELETGKITNQNASGRCWMFAALNTMRVPIMRKLNLDTFELSQNYSFFYDKLEKANYFLESILETLDEPLEGRLLAHLLSAPVQDGGQWDMYASIIIKYGVVPKDNMPETFHSSNSGMLCRLLTAKLREYAAILRDAHANGASADALRPRKEAMLEEVYGILAIALGEPPREVSWEGRDKDKNFVRIQGLTPQEFFREYVGWDITEYVSLINAPTPDKPYGRTFTVEYLGNIVGGQPIRYLNLPIEELKKAAIAQMQAGEPVWFGCDVGQYLDGDWGSMDREGFDYASVLGTGLGMNKAQRLMYGDSLMTHAMVFQGVNLDEDGRPNRWKVENSWGDKRGNEGAYIMADSWFDEFLYQIVVNKKYLTEEQRAMLDQDPISLKPWDPMGSLAHMR